MKPLVLDSALGTEIENRGEFLPSFKTSKRKSRTERF
jgi:hypothetical protein